MNLGGFTAAQFTQGQRRFAEAVRSASLSVSNFANRPTEAAAKNDVLECMVPGCEQPTVVLLANDAPLLSPEYAERWVCQWHRNNPFGAQA